MFSKKSAKKKVTIKSNSPYTCRLDAELLNPKGVEGDAVQSWRVFRIMSEFVQGFELLRDTGLAATFWGSARLQPTDRYYKDAEELSAKLAKKGFAIVSGGGPGIMEASNVGAFKVGGKSIGLNIHLPFEQKLNPYTTLSQSFDFFFSRKVMLTFASEVYVYFPGGFGTMDEFFEIVTLIQTKKINQIPIVLYGKEFWEPLLRFFEKDMCKKFGMVNPEDLTLFELVDSVDDAYKYIMKHVDTKSLNKQI